MLPDAERKKEKKKKNISAWQACHNTWTRRASTFSKRKHILVGFQLPWRLNLKPDRISSEAMRDHSHASAGSRLEKKIICC